MSQKIEIDPFALIGPIVFAAAFVALVLVLVSHGCYVQGRQDERATGRYYMAQPKVGGQPEQP